MEFENTHNSLLIIFIVVEIYLNYSWAKWYFERGIVVYKKKFKCNIRALKIRDIPLCEAKDKKPINTYIFKRKGDSIFFRKTFFDMSTITMHGKIEVNSEKKEIIVTGILNIFTILGVTIAISLIAHIGFVLTVFGFLIIWNYSERDGFDSVGQVMAKLLESKGRNDDEAA